MLTAMMVAAIADPTKDGSACPLEMECPTKAADKTCMSALFHPQVGPVSVTRPAGTRSVRYPLIPFFER